MSDRDLFANVGEEYKPDSTKRKRKAPKEQLTQEQVKARKRAKELKVGRVVAFRIHPDVADEFAAIAKELNVRHGRLAEFVLRQAIRAYKRKQLDVPLNERGVEMLLEIVQPEL